MMKADETRETKQLKTCWDGIEDMKSYGRSQDDEQAWNKCSWKINGDGQLVN